MSWGLEKVALTLAWGVSCFWTRRLVVPKSTQKRECTPLGCYGPQPHFLFL